MNRARANHADEQPMSQQGGADERSLSNDAFSGIRDMILSYQLRPGEKLVDRTLAERFGVSRTPIREALARLSESNLVVNRGGRGYFVADVDSKQAADLYELREILELHAVAAACLNATEQDVEELRSILRALDKVRNRPERSGEKLLVSNQLHEVIARASGNHALHDAVARLLHRMSVFVWLEASHETRTEADVSYADHVALVDLIRDKESAEAVRVMRRHIRTAKAHIVKILRTREALFKRRRETADGDD